jgi:hypothetical protein
MGSVFPDDDPWFVVNRAAGRALIESCWPIGGCPSALFTIVPV